MKAGLGAMFLIALVACGTDGVSSMPATASRAPALGETDSLDASDHACQVVLRGVGRNLVNEGGELGYEKSCTGRVCNFVWTAGIDVAEEVPEDVKVKVLYHLTTDPQWYEVSAFATGEQRYGYRAYAAKVSDHLFGPKTEGEGKVIELVAFLEYADGKRLFDHNSLSGDFENVRLTAENSFGASLGGCQPVLGHIFFSPSFSQSVTGALRQGGYLEIFYMLERLPECRDTHNGYPCWDILAHGRFLPGGQEFSGSVRRFVSANGTPTNEAEPQPFAVKIPKDAEEVEIWFENYSGCGSTCRTWDSNFGANYHFPIWPSPDHPRCKGVVKDNLAIRGEDVRMVHLEPYCLAYDIAGQYDANFCEFWPEDAGLGYIGHYGIPYRWLLSDLRTGSNDGQVMAVGLFVRYHNNKDGQEDSAYALGNEVAPGLWRTGFIYQSWSPNDPNNTRDYAIDEFAFFADVKRPSGEVVRLWQSRGGQNFRPQDMVSCPSCTEPIPYGNIQWADQSSVIFDSKRACVH